ncbi:MAG: hypothetical protein WEA09_14050 [Gemmatimonadota bacterium]
MSLIPFHRGLIATAIVFCYGYGVWEAISFSRTGAGLSLVMASLFVVLGSALVYYLSRMNRFLGYGSEGRPES